jgi:translation elongation factor EF-4
MDILLNGQPVDAMATIVHNQKAQRVGRELVEKLKKFIDRYPSTFFFGHVNCASDMRISLSEHITFSSIYKLHQKVV